MSFGVNNENFLNRVRKNRSVYAQRCFGTPAKAHRDSQKPAEADFEHTLTQMTLKHTENDFARPIKHIAMVLDAFRSEE